MKLPGATMLAVLLPFSVAAQGVETVKIGQQVKRAFGIVTGMNAGDTACYLKLKDNRGATFEEMAGFDFCEQRSLVGKRVALSYILQSVMSPECQGDPACKKTVSVVLVSAARPMAASPPTAASPPAAAATRPTASFCNINEAIVFSCRTSSRLISVCASKGATATSGHLQYRHGKLDSGEPAEIIQPTALVPPPKAATGGSFPLAGGGGAWLRFTIGQLNSTVYTAIGRLGPKGEVAERAGMVAEHQGKQIASLKCVGKPVSELGPDWFDRVGIKTNGQDFDLPD